MHVLVTGHTGFKGAWATLLLRHHGHEVSGIALDPLPGSLFERVGLGEAFQSDVRTDIRDEKAVLKAFHEIQPDVVLHMAAQPLVRVSYNEPRWTMETNVMGTLSVLEAMAATSSVAAAVMVTTDKVYRNIGQAEGYAEDDSLGGRDPYSASKAMADILISSWNASFDSCPVATARAGNVIGGGDVCADRLVPDLMRGFQDGQSVAIRYPDAIRPWQHVLDCLNGYLLLIDALLNGTGSGAWNFGPTADSVRTVRDVADRAATQWGDEASWKFDRSVHPDEEAILVLDSSRARRELGWSDELDFSESIDWTIEWAKQVQMGASPREVTSKQISTFCERVEDSA